MNRVFLSFHRFAFVLALLLLGFTTLLGRLVYLHVFMQDEYGYIAEQNRERFELLPSRRGDILDCNRNVLATSKEVREVGVDPHVLLQSDLEKVPELAQLLNLPEADLYALLQPALNKNGAPVRWRKLADAVDESVYLKILNLGIKGVYGNSKYQRYYPGGELAAHVIGYLNKSGEKGQAVMGAEHFLDFYLSGQDGWRESEKDGRRREIVAFRHREVIPVNGYSVELSIDQFIQHKVEEALQVLADRYEPASASIIVSEPKTGFILALGNYPTFDLNTYSTAPLDHQRNRALTDVFEPGSTFKIVAAAGALEEGLVAPADQFDCDVSNVEYQGRTLRLPKDHRDMGLLTVEDIVARSSNRGAAFLGLTLGEHQLHHYAQQFGFGQPTELGLVGESGGVLHPVNRWDGLMITRIPMGHAVSATPIQVHQAMAVIANSGRAMRLQFVRKVITGSGEVVHQYRSRPVRQVVSTKVAQDVADMLHKAVGPSGTARKAFIEGYRVAGKTGTTQKIINGRYSSKNHVASFSGFLPYNDPKLLITVVVDDPKLEGIGYGGKVAAPVFNEIASHCIHYLGKKFTSE